MKTSVQARNYLVILGLGFFLVTAASVYAIIDKNNKTHKNLATGVARTFFETFLASRTEIAQHGGVYVPETEKIKPNPYLDDPLRDVTTKEGLRLTKINPAYMTRLISEALRQKKGLHIHLTSLRPIRPGNRPDEWEKKALEGFNGAVSERADIVAEGESVLFRYIAPLRTEESCLKCHAKQGYKAGDTRGGLSVSFSYSPFLNAARRQNEQVLLISLVLFLLGTAIIFLLGRKLIVKIVELQDASLHIKRLEGMLPICANCKRIRDDRGDWTQIESYIRNHSEAEFSHGICPDCAKALYPEYFPSLQGLPKS